MTDISESGSLKGTKTAVLLGIFDGVHIGHREVYKAAEGERKSGLKTAVFTFLSGSVTTKGSIGLIYPEKTKREIFDSLGADFYYSPEFYKLKDLSAEEFFNNVIIKKLGAKVICCGEDFRFGKNASAGVSELRKMCDSSGIRLKVVSPVLYKGQAVSSTRIKNALISGDIESANDMLSQGFGYSERVIHGRELGRKLDFPTINQQIPSGTVLPRFGVYLSEVSYKGKKYRGVSNVGVKPTVGKNDPIIETHILGLNESLYGNKVRVELKKFMREEIRFDTVTELKLQVLQDIENAGKEVM